MLHEGDGLEEATPGRVSNRGNDTVSVSSRSPPKDILDGYLGREDAAQSLLGIDREI